MGRSPTPISCISTNKRVSQTRTSRRSILDKIRNERYAMFLNSVGLDIEAKDKERAVKAFYNWIKNKKTRYKTQLCFK